MEKEPSPHSAKSIARNITVGVVTPVLAAAIIYFLGFNRGDKTEFNKKKEATVKAWNMYMQNKDIFASVFKQMDDSNATMEELRGRVNHEIDVTVDNMEAIKKDGNADQRVYSTIDIVSQQIKDIKPLMNTFIDDMENFLTRNPSVDEVKDFAAEKQDGLLDQVYKLKKRDSIRLNVFYNDLNKEYGVKLPDN
ncbi:MAG: hypothetical protein JST86_20600 [Bacteroidetes bacterium]|nr:hypothetical protein [Bacteroidota bacterium]